MHIQVVITSHLADCQLPSDRLPFLSPSAHFPLESFPKVCAAVITHLRETFRSFPLHIVQFPDLACPFAPALFHSATGTSSLGNTTQSLSGWNALFPTPEQLSPFRPLSQSQSQCYRHGSLPMFLCLSPLNFPCLHSP